MELGKTGNPLGFRLSDKEKRNWEVGEVANLNDNRNVDMGLLNIIMNAVKS